MEVSNAEVIHEGVRLFHDPVNNSVYLPWLNMV